MFRDKTIRKMVAEVLEAKIEDAQRTYEEVAEELDLQLDEEIAEAEARNREKKATTAIDLANKVLGR